MNQLKKAFIIKIFEIHEYLKELDKQEILKIKEILNKTTDQNKKDLITEYIKFREKKE